MLTPNGECSEIVVFSLANSLGSKFTRVNGTFTLFLICGAGYRLQRIILNAKPIPESGESFTVT